MHRFWNPEGTLHHLAQSTCYTDEEIKVSVMQLRRNRAGIGFGLQAPQATRQCVPEIQPLPIGCYSSQLLLLASVFSSVKWGPHHLSFKVILRIK